MNERGANWQISMNIHREFTVMNLCFPVAFNHYFRLFTYRNDQHPK